MTSTSGGEAIVNGLVAHGVDTVFGLPGASRSTVCSMPSTRPN